MFMIDCKEALVTAMAAGTAKLPELIVYDSSKLHCGVTMP